MRILVAFEEEYRSFRDVISDALRLLRPADEVEACGLDALGEEARRLDPHLVIASVPNVLEGRVAWVELSPQPERPSRVCVGGRLREAANPTIYDLLSTVGEVEGLVRSDRPLRAC